MSNHRWTETEKDEAAHLAQSAGLRAASKESGISIGTIRIHLAANAARAKTKTRPGRWARAFAADHLAHVDVAAAAANAGIDVDDAKQAWIDIIDQLDPRR